MAKLAGQDMEVVRHGDAVLLALLCSLRDELHRLAAEVAEDVATPERHAEMGARLRDVGHRVRCRGRRLRIRGAPEL